MGQRLVINITDKDGKSLANAYYHWSGYTNSAASTLMDMLDNYDELKEQYKDKKELAIRLLEETGAGLNEEEVEEKPARRGLFGRKRKASKYDEDEDEDDYDDDDEDYDEDEEPLFFEVTCPACDNTITIDEDVLNLGAIQCPNCGEMLEFDLDEDEDEEEDD